MRTHFTTPAHLPMWIAGTFISLIAVLGIAATLRWTPASYANILDEGALSRHGAVPSGFEDAQAIDAQAQFDVARPAVNRRSRVWCDECGVVESMRQIKRFRDVGGQSSVVAAVGGDVGGREPNPAIAATSGPQMRYEFTVRFRDGSNKAFNDTSPRAWPLGSRVIVIGRSNASKD